MVIFIIQQAGDNSAELDKIDWRVRKFGQYPQ